MRPTAAVGAVVAGAAAAGTLALCPVVAPVAGASAASAASTPGATAVLVDTTTTDPSTTTTSVPATTTTVAPTTTVPPTTTTEPRTTTTSSSTSTTTTTTTPIVSTNSSGGIPIAWVVIIVILVAAIVAVIVALIRRRRNQSARAWHRQVVPAVSDVRLAREALLSGNGASDDPEVRGAVSVQVDRAASALDRAVRSAPDEEDGQAAAAVAESLRGLAFAVEADRLLRHGSAPPTGMQLAEADEAKRARTAELDGALARLGRRISPDGRHR